MRFYIASTEAPSVYDEVMTYICVTLDIPLYIIAGNYRRCHECSKQHSEGKRTRGHYISCSDTSGSDPI